MNLNEKIRTARKAAELTHQQVADTLGIDRTAVVKWESGVSRPSLDRLQSYADLVRIPIDWFMHEDDTPARPEGPVVAAVRHEVGKQRTLGQLQRDFWDDVKQHFFSSIRFPAYARTLAPDILTEHYAIECAVQPRPYFHQLANSVARISLAARLIDNRHPALLLYVPPEKDVQVEDERKRLKEFPRVIERTRELCEGVGVQFFVVNCKKEAMKVLQSELQ